MKIVISIGFFFVFFFKQKTAYEIRPCDWSSDVCSSDLLERSVDLRGLAALAVEHGHLEFVTKRLDRVGRVLRAPAGLARPALCHPRADGLQEPCAPFQEEGFELLHDPMIERVCPLHSVLALSRRHSLGRRDPTSDSSG